MDLFPFDDKLNSIKFGFKIDLKKYLIGWFGANLFNKYKKRFHKSTFKLFIRLILNSPYIIFFTPNRTIKIFIDRFNQNLDKFNRLQTEKFRKYERAYRNRKIVSEFVYPVITPHILLYRPDMIFDVESEKFWNRYLYDWFGISLPTARKITRNEQNLLRLVRYIFLASKEMNGLLGYRYVHRYKTIEGIEDRFKFEYICNKESYNYIVNTISQNPTAYIGHESSFVQNIILKNWKNIPDSGHKKSFLSNLLKHNSVSLIKIRNYVSHIENILTPHFLKNIFLENQKKYAISNSYRDCLCLNSLANTFHSKLVSAAMTLRIAIEEGQDIDLSNSSMIRYIIKMYNSALFRNDPESMEKIFTFYEKNRGYIENFYYLSKNIKNNPDLEKITENIGNILLPSLSETKSKCVLLEKSILLGFEDDNIDKNLISERVGFTNINKDTSTLFLHHIGKYMSLKKIISTVSSIYHPVVDIFVNIYMGVIDKYTVDSENISVYYGSKYLNRSISTVPSIMLYSVFKFIEKNIEHHTNQYIKLPNKEFIKNLTKIDKKTTAYDFLIRLEKIEELVESNIRDITNEKSMNLFYLMKKFFRMSKKKTIHEILKKYKNKSYNGINSAVYIHYGMKYIDS